jgi:mono/diheme cytochrome c family protein
MKRLPVAVTLGLALALAVSAVALAVSTVAWAQDGEEVPPPYAGATNPFDWEDAAARDAGSDLYGRSCLGCHGATGGQVRSADFSGADFPEELAANADYYYWITTEGRMSAGMPPFKSSLTDDERWQILTYMGSLASAPPADGEEPADGIAAGAIKLDAPQEAQAGEPIALSAFLMDANFDPLPDATVTFYALVDFFIEEWAEIGQAVTDDDGEAVATVTLHVADDHMQVAARYRGVESIQTINVASADEPNYVVHVGLHLPDFTDDLVFGPEEAFSLREGGRAPTTYFRWPGDMQALLFFLYAGGIALVWGLYLRTMYQLFKIPVMTQLGSPDNRLVPFIGLVILAGLLALLIGILVTGPQSHFHVLH